MSEKLYPILKAAKQPLIDKATYEAWYKESITQPDIFWAKQATKELVFIKKWDKVSDHTFTKDDAHIRWFDGATLNVCYNCVDRHAEASPERTAIIWEGDDPSESKKITYAQLKSEVSKFANILKSLGVKKGDVVTIYLPMILEATYSMLACARIGAIHSVVFGGFSSEALKGRIEDGSSKLVITADEGLRGGKKVPLKNNVDEALKDNKTAKVLVVKRTGGNINWKEGRDIWYHDEYKKAADSCPCEEMDAESPLFILYTSGSTGKPKGLLHTSAGYLLYVAITHKYTFDYHINNNETSSETRLSEASSRNTRAENRSLQKVNEDSSTDMTTKSAAEVEFVPEVYWCTADIGWVTGHSYIVYGPLANGATTLMFEGIPTYPDASRFWQVVDKHKVNQFYTAPTAIRMLMASGEEPVKKTSRKSLRILGSVGEPINPEAWRWYFDVVGDSRCPIVDTWWQTETGGFMITPLPYATPAKPGSATKPFFGIKPAIVDADNRTLEGECEGSLCIDASWPGQARTIWGDHKRFFETYFAPFPGRYFSGDGAKRDADGYYWVTGRMDDILKISGHRIGSAEVESALVLNRNVAEAAVVGFPHDIKGQGIYAFVTLKQNVEGTDALKKELTEGVRNSIGPIAKPDIIQFAPQLPKTRSGKIMRRILRKIACNDYGDLGDTKTLLNPEAVDELIKNRLNK